MSRRGLVAVLLAGLAVVAVAVALARAEQEAPPVVSPPLASLAPDARTSDDLARAACLRLRLASQGIQADSPAQVVRGELAAARALAAEAVRRDGRWAALSGGIAGLDDAVTRDAGADAVNGLRVALAECDRVRAE